MRAGTTALLVIETMEDISSKLKRIIRRRRVSVGYNFTMYSLLVSKQALDHVQMGRDSEIMGKFVALLIQNTLDCHSNRIP